MNTSIFLVAIGALLLVAVVAVLALVWQQMRRTEEAQRLLQQVQERLNIGEKNTEERLDRAARGIAERLDGNTRGVSARISENASEMGKRLDAAARTVSELKVGMARVSALEGNVRELVNIFRSTKIRGTSGERLLEEMLRDRLPADRWKREHSFPGSTARVDFIIRTRSGDIPVDSKFPVDVFRALVEANTPEEEEPARKKFEAAIKKHIREIAQKYIAPQHGTTNFAVMYLPSESMFYEAMVRSEEIAPFSAEQGVFLASPNILSVMLEVVLRSFEAERAGHRAEVVLTQLRGLSVAAKNLGEDLGTLGRHVEHASKSFSKTRSSFDSLENRLSVMSAPTIDAPASAEEAPALFAEQSLENGADIEVESGDNKEPS